MKSSLGLTRKLSPFAVRLSWFLVLILILPWLVGVGQASTSIVVNTTEDVKKGNDGLCSLREAIIAANTDKKEGGKPGECPAGNGPDTIILPAGTYFLTRTDNGNEDASQTGDLDITDDLNIVGSPGVTIDASGITDRVFHILSGEVTITGVTIKNGGSNVGDGGGIHNSGALTLSNVTISGNRANASGGGIYNAGSLTLNNSTIANNIAATYGGGIVNSGGIVNFQNTIIAGNTAASIPDDCLGVLSSLGHNLVGDGAGCPVTGTDVEVDPADVFTNVLGPLHADFTGTQVHALLRGSPAIDAGDNTTCLITDQRGEPRPMDGDGDGLSICDIGAYEVGPEPLVLIRAFPNDQGGTTIQGLLRNFPYGTFALNAYTAATCPTGYGPVPDGQLLGSPEVSTDEHGYFTTSIDASVPTGHIFVTGTATDADGNTTEFSRCITVGLDNTSWPYAYSLDGLFSSPAVFEQYIDQLDQSRWFKFTVEPQSEVIVTLTGLLANFDLTVYKDIRATFDQLTDPGEEDLLRLGAEFAPDAFSPDAFSPDAFSPDAFSPDAFSPDAFSPDAFSPDAFSPDAFSPDAFSPDAFSPDAFSPDAFSPDAFSPDAFSPDAFSPDAFSPDAFSPDAFSGAQSRSLLAVSAFEGTASEGIILNTWNNTGEFYVRVRGRNGAFSLDGPFTLMVWREPGTCGGIPPLPNTDPLAPVGNPKALILTDLSRWNRIEGTPEEKEALQARLIHLASEVDGVLVDVSQDDRVNDANFHADANPECPYAKNLVAQAIKDIIDGYRTQPASNLEYVVIVGGDEIIPFPRHPDNALLANEMNYVPPVKDNTASQASLKLGYVLSQDAYGSKYDISLNNSTFPIPELAVGRLVETASDMNTVLDAYLSGTNGGVVTPQTSLVTGYDFLEDAALAIRVELEAGTQNLADTLIAERDLSPADPAAWTADALRAALLGSRHDLVFLAGHFSANSALAADYTTRLLAEEVATSSVDLGNAIIFSAGCHSGYNIVNQHGVPNVTREPDWAQAFAQKGAALVAGTGYQYGDTDFLEYSELLYLEFSKQLRLDTGGPISIGQALVGAKRAYLAQTPQITGLHEKALLEATIFGLPMLSVDLPGRHTPPGDTPEVPSTTIFNTNPGLTLGLAWADVTVTSPLDEHFVTLDNLEGGTVTASYLSGNDGTVTHPAEPALPLEVLNVSVPGTVLRGALFLGGSYTEQEVLPLTGAATTEIRGVHAPFLSDVLYPVRPWRINYFDALVGGSTRLMVTPAQHKTSPVSGYPQLSTRRQFSQMNFRLYYNNNTDTFTGNPDHPSTPALAAPPAIAHVSAIPGDGEVTFRVQVVGNPAAGIQEVWVTYTATSAPWYGQWQSLPLTQRAGNSTLWEGTLTLSASMDSTDIRYFVQAVNGVGLVSMAPNLGAYFTPGFDPEPTLGTQLTFLSPPESGPYGTQETFTAKLTSQGAGLSGQVVIFRLGPQTRIAVTDGNGDATVILSLLGLPGQYELRASYLGTADYKPVVATETFTIHKQDTDLSLDPLSATVFPGDDPGMVATLTDATGRRLGEKTVFFVVTDSGVGYSVAEITDYAGRASLGPIPLPPGDYVVKVYFGGTIPLYTGEVVTVDDSRYNPSTATGALNITINTPPEANDDTATTNEDTSVTIDVADNDTDIDGNLDPTSVNVDCDTCSEPANGTLVNNGDGTFTYTPDADYYGTDSFVYEICDTEGACDTATVNITVNPVSDPPQANDDTATTDEDTPVTIDVADNDTDVDGNLDPTSANIACGTCSEPANGTLVNNYDGTFTYTPDADYYGMDSFVYEICDTEGACDTATVTITVYQGNQPPDCSGATSEPGVIWPPDKDFWPVSVLDVTDPDGDPIVITITGIRQDEPVGKGKSSPDGGGVGTSTAEVRAERDGNGDGRVYHIYFTADDGRGGTCDGEVRTAIVTHDQSGDLDAIDGGALYDSITGDIIETEG